MGPQLQGTFCRRSPMTVFPVRRGYLPAPATPTRASVRPRATSEARLEPLDAARPSLGEWAQRRRAERDARRIAAIGGRVVERLGHLGPSWHLVDWPRSEMVRARRYDLGAALAPDSAGLLAIGPSGIFAITIVEHGRARVLLAGDVMQINGRRPPYVAQA